MKRTLSFLFLTIVSLPVYAEFIPQRPNTSHNNVTETPQSVVITKTPQTEPVQLEPRVAQYTQQSQPQGNAHNVLGTNALNTYNGLIKPIAQEMGLQPIMADLLTAIIHARNPTFNPQLDEGNGQPGYGYGLALISIIAGNQYGAGNPQQLYDPTTNVKIGFEILRLGMAKYNNDVNKTVNWYMTGNPDVTDSKSVNSLQVLKALRGQ